MEKNGEDKWVHRVKNEEVLRRLLQHVITRTGILTTALEGSGK